MEFKTLTGKTLTKITGGVRDDEMVFETQCGETYRLYYYDD